MKALIDADILVYRVGFTTQEEPYDIAEARMQSLVEKILADTLATSYQLYLTATTDNTAFRFKTYPEYKQNRKSPKPIHYQALREFLVEKWGAIVCTVIEADDALGIAQSNRTEDTVIVTIDKDLNMIEGFHYNFVKEEQSFIYEEDAIRFFYKQLLMGDTADNIKGIAGIGPKKADTILGDAVTEEELFTRVREAYDNDDEMLQNGDCLWILREPYPKGVWRYTTYGSKLLQERTLPVLSLCETTEPITESIGVETYTDGYLANGRFLAGSITL